MHGGATTELRAGVLINRHATARTIASQPLSWGYLVRAWKVLARPLVVHLHAPNMLAALALALHPWLRAHVVVHWHSDVVGTGVNVPVGDPAALAAACQRLLADELTRERMGAAARQRFETLFKAEAAAAAWLDLYQEVSSA